MGWEVGITRWLRKRVEIARRKVGADGGGKGKQVGLEGRERVGPEEEEVDENGKRVGLEKGEGVVKGRVGGTGREV